MCGGLRINRVQVRPGSSIRYRTIIGEKTGVWGLGHGSGAYNARVENLSTTWKKIQVNRAVVHVDSFEEKGIDFKVGYGTTILAAIFNDIGEIVILTCPSKGSVKAIHHRMPLILADETNWLNGDAAILGMCSVYRAVKPPVDKRRAFLQSLPARR